MARSIRLTKPLLAVMFGTGKRTLCRLPVDVDIDVLGSSVIQGCLEIVWADTHYHVFKEDLMHYSTASRAVMAVHA